MQVGRKWKQERLNEIINLVNKAGTVYVQDIMESMQVVGYDGPSGFDWIESKGPYSCSKWSQSNQFLPSRELPHEEKLLKNILAKREVAKKASELIKEEGESISLGPGTSAEVLPKPLIIRNRVLKRIRKTT